MSTTQDQVSTVATSVNSRCIKPTSQETSVDSHSTTMNPTASRSTLSSSANASVEANFQADYSAVNQHISNIHLNPCPTSSSQPRSLHFQIPKTTSSSFLACAQSPSKSHRPFPKNEPTRSHSWTQPLSQRTYRSRSNLHPPMKTKTRENKMILKRKNYSNVKRWRIYLNVLNKSPIRPRTLCWVTDLSQIFRNFYQKMNKQPRRRRKAIYPKKIICFSRNLFLWQVSWTCLNKLIPVDRLPGRRWAIIWTTWRKTIKFSTQSYRAWTSRIIKWVFHLLSTSVSVVNVVTTSS